MDEIEQVAMTKISRNIQHPKKNKNKIEKEEYQENSIRAIKM